MAELPVELSYGDTASGDYAEQVTADSATQAAMVVLDSKAVALGARQGVDGQLGSGWYEEWQSLSQDTRELRQRAAVNYKRFEAAEASGARMRLHWDMRVLESIAADYDAVMSRAANGEPIDVAATKALHDVYTLAIGVADEDNNALDAAFAIGVVAAFVLVPFALLRARGLRLQDLLKALKAQLETAKNDVTEAWMQTLLDVAIAGVTTFTPVGLVTRGGLLVGQGIFDTAMGPSTSTAATVGAHSSKAAEFLGAVGDVKAAASKQKTVAKAGGASATVVGFVFDANELRVAYKNVDRLSSSIKQAEDALKKLIDVMNEHEPALQRFAMQYEQWQISIASIRTNADATRQALDNDLQRIAYQVR